MPTPILHSHVAIISDVHVGTPESPTLEDFDRDADFARLLDKEVPRRTANANATLVINGDFIDFPQILPELGPLSPSKHLGTTESESHQRVCKALEGHPVVFDSMRRFLAAGNQILLLPGNHDIDLHFPAVLAAIRTTLGNPSAPAFDFIAEGFIAQDRVHIEHGNQYSYDNYFEHWHDPIRPGPNGVPRIERPWGTMFMDLVYNDIEDLYPFVNKVYPQSALARITLRLVRQDSKRSLSTIAEIVSFFVRRGKRMMLGRLLGEEDAPDLDQPEVTLADIEEVLSSLDAEPMDPVRREALVTEVARLTGAVEVATHETHDDEPPEGLLGRSDERGLDARARELWQTGRIDIVIFGHTHEPVNRTVPLAGRSCRLLNTGGWIPLIPVPKGAKPSLQDLMAAKREHELRYAWLELNDGAATATLERLDPS